MCWARPLHYTNAPSELHLVAHRPVKVKEALENVPQVGPSIISRLSPVQITSFCFSLADVETAKVSASYDAFLPLPLHSLFSSSCYILTICRLNLACGLVIFGPDCIKKKHMVELDSNI